MNINKESLERMVQENRDNGEDEGPLPDTSYVMSDVDEIIEKLKLHREKKLDKHLSLKNFKVKLEGEYPKLFDNFPTIFNKVCAGTLEKTRLAFMLKMIGEVKGSKISKHEASVVVGQELVNNIVKPNLKDPK